MNQAETDGRSSRWDRHREERYAALVAASVRAIDEHGPDVAIATIAADAGVSKPVLYRYFADKDELHAAVGRWGAAEVIIAMMPIFLAEATVRDRIRNAVDAYLGVIDEHPQVFNLLVRQRGVRDPLADGKARIVESVDQILTGSLRQLDLDPGGIEAWSQGMLGLALNTGEWWLETRTLSRDEVRDQLADFIWHAFGGLVRRRGAELSVLDGTIDRLIDPA